MRRVLQWMLLVLFAFLNTGFSQQAWERIYGGTGDEYSYSVAQTQDNGYIVTGYTTSFGNGYQLYIVKTDSTGDTLWTRIYGGTSTDYGNAVEQTSDGGYIVTGYTYFSSDSKVYLIKTDTSGDSTWTRTYGGSEGESGNAVQQTTDLGYIVVGSTLSFGNGRQVYLVRTNALGDTLWTRNYGGADYEEGRFVRQTSDGGYIIAGRTDSYGNDAQVYLIKTNGAGDTLWTRTFGGAGFDEGYAVRQTSDGGYIIAGTTTSFGSSYQVYVIKTGSTGDTLWTRTYGSFHVEDGYSVWQTSDGGYIIGGATYSFGNNSQVYLVRTNGVGDTLWTMTFGGTGYDYGMSVQQTADSGYIVAGNTNSFGDSNQVYLIKIPADGQINIDEHPGQKSRLPAAWSAEPSPFVSHTSVPGGENEDFIVYDVSGRMVARCKGNRIGEGLVPGVYMIVSEGQNSTCLRAVKIR